MPDYAGLIKYPTGSDIYGGDKEPQWWKDLATTTLAQITASGTYRTHISGTFNADNAPDGTDLVHLAASQTGTPEQGTWWITTATIVDTARMQVAVSYGAAPRVMRRFRGSGGWSGWERTDAGAIDLSALGGGGSGASPAAFKTVPLALTAGGSAAAGPTSGVYRMPIRFGATITRWRAHFRNINPRFGTDGPTVSLPSVHFGKATAGQFTETSTRVGSASISTDTAGVATAWQSTPIEAGVEYALSYQFSGTATNRVVGGGWSASSVNALGATLTRVVSLPLDVWIEAEVAPDVPVIAAFGDSLSAGVGATLPVFDSWLSQWARANGALPVHYAASGDTMAGWADSNAYKWQRWQGLTRPDAVIHAMGNNDVFGGADLSTMRTRRIASVEQLRQLVSPVIYTATITPRTSSTGAAEDIRRQYNIWLKIFPDAARDVFDFVPAISGDDENISPGFDADGIHLNTAGYAAVAGTITRPLASTASRDALTRLAAIEYDSGIRDLTAHLLSSDWVADKVLLTRTPGNHVTVTVSNLRRVGSQASSVFYTLPVGFRPVAMPSLPRSFYGLVGSGNPPRTAQMDIDQNGHMRLFVNTGETSVTGTLTWGTPDPIPTSPPGTPA